MIMQLCYQNYVLNTDGNLILPAENVANIYSLRMSLPKAGETVAVFLNCKEKAYYLCDLSYDIFN